MLNGLRTEDKRWVRVVPSKRQSDKVVGVLKRETKAKRDNLVLEVRTRDNEAGIDQDDKVRIGQYNKAGIEKDDKTGTR